MCALVGILASQSLLAATFTTSFEGQAVVTPTAFTITSNDLTSTFTGGTAFSAGNTDLYFSGTVSWMLEPLGVNNSTGEAVMTLTEPASRMTLQVVREPTAMGRLQIIDTTGTVVVETGISSTDVGFGLIVQPQPDGDPLIKTVKVLHDGGTGMVAVDDIEYVAAVADADDDDDSEGFAVGPLLLVLGGGVWLLVGRRRG